MSLKWDQTFQENQDRTLQVGPILLGLVPKPKPKFLFEPIDLVHILYCVIFVFSQEKVYLID
jgi:hypothetical protein